MNKNTSPNFFASIPDFILDSKRAEIIERIREFFPALHDTIFGFETVLNKEDSNTDFSICLSDKHTKNIIENPEGKSIDRFFRKYSYWGKFRKFIPTVKDDAMVKSTWFEFDLEPGSSNAIFPSLFIKLAPGLEHNHALKDKFKSLLEGRNHKRLLKTIERCSKLYSPGNFIEYISYIPNKNPDAVRLCVSHLSFSDLKKYINIFTGGPVPDLSHLENLSVYSDYLVLHITAGEENEPQLAVEVRWTDDPFLNMKRKREFLDYAFEHNLCNEAFHSFFRNWEGKNRYFFDKELYKYIIYKCIFYYKTIFTPDDLLLKAYYGFISRIMD